jgi:hypothetical protein
MSTSLYPVFAADANLLEGKLLVKNQQQTRGKSKKLREGTRRQQFRNKEGHSLHPTRKKRI